MTSWPAPLWADRSLVSTSIAFFKEVQGICLGTDMASKLENKDFVVVRDLAQSRIHSKYFVRSRGGPSAVMYTISMFETRPTQNAVNFSGKGGNVVCNS